MGRQKSFVEKITPFIDNMRGGVAEGGVEPGPGPEPRPEPVVINFNYELLNLKHLDAYLSSLKASFEENPEVIPEEPSKNDPLADLIGEYVEAGIDSASVVVKGFTMTIPAKGGAETDVWDFEWETDVDIDHLRHYDFTNICTLYDGSQAVGDGYLELVSSTRGTSYPSRTTGTVAIEGAMNAMDEIYGTAASVSNLSCKLILNVSDGRVINVVMPAKYTYIQGE